MSHTTPSDPDFWEFVGCSTCHLQFMSEPGRAPQVPFWLTECGHVVCNNHLNADQSCAQCGAQNIQLAPLQQEMDPPMSNWFDLVPRALDNIASAAQFQFNTMAHQIRYHRARYQQFGELVKRMRLQTAEVKSLKKKLEELTQENDHLRSRFGAPLPSHPGAGEPSSSLNSNGKRQTADQHRHSKRLRDGDTSSPRSIVTPLGQDRLTLPLVQQAPNLSDQRDREDRRDAPLLSEPQNALHGTSNQRPESSRLIEQYAYVPPQSPQVIAGQLSHEQSAPLRQLRHMNHRGEQSPATPKALPPSSAGRFRPAQGGFSMNTTQGYTAQGHHRASLQNELATSDRRKMSMGPPPLPLHKALPNTDSQGNRISASVPANARNGTPMPSQRTMYPPPSRLGPRNSYGPLPPATTQQFSSGTPGSGPQRFLAPHAGTSVSRVLSRPASSMPTSRMPFVPSQGGLS